jgi:site-specific recombinase XerC
MEVPLNSFIQFLERKGLNQATVQQYAYQLLRFQSKYNYFNQESISLFLSEPGHRNTQTRAFVKNFKEYLKMHRKELNLLPNIYEDILETEIPRITGRTKSKIVRPLSEEQVLMLENYMQDERMKLMLLLSFYCGLRVNELYRIQVISFNWTEWRKNPEEYGECIVYGKGGKEGLALVPSKLMKRTARFIREKGFINVQSRIFLRKKDQKISLKNACRHWQVKLREAGVKSGITLLDENNHIIPETKVHPHRLRHSFATHLLKIKKMGIREVQELLRHSSIQSTQIYTHLDKGDLKEKLNQADIKDIPDDAPIEHHSKNPLEE